MKTLFERLLEHFNLTEEDYKKLTAPVDETNFAMGHKFDRIDEIAEFVHTAVDDNKKIIVYGDYDADGIMATSIMVKMFSYIGYKVDYFIPNRYTDGYGINLDKAKEIVGKGYDLVITVDNGISAFEPISFLRDNDVDVLVFDHHEMQGNIPNCTDYLHPILSHFGDVASSGAFVCFMFSIAFLKNYEKYLATLASISLITDMMPLQEYNRNLLRLVFKNYIPGEFQAIDLLKGDEEFNEITIGMAIGPKINSVGRIGEDEPIGQLVDYFVSEDEEKLLNYFSWISELNEKRKNISKNFSGIDEYYCEISDSIVVRVDEKEGIIGLIATSLVNKYKKPSIVFAVDASGEYLKGSCRAPAGFNVVDAFEQAKDLLATFGGHALAGGCLIKIKDFEKFKTFFEEYCATHPIVKEDIACVPMRINELTFENLELIRSFSPFGEKMKAPTFVLPRLKTSALMFSRGGDHIITPVGMNAKITGFNLPKPQVRRYQFIDAYGSLRKNEYRGFVNVEFLISEIKDSTKY